MKDFNFTNVALVVIIVLLFVGYTQREQTPPLGSVVTGSDYAFNQVSASGTSTLRTRTGTLGSIVVESVSAAGGQLNIYATTSQATSSADLVLSFDATALEGTYTYDVSVANGILLEAKNFDGDAVITHR
jgi:hypothetical protein